MNDNQIGDYAAFFAFYLREHQNPVSRALHYTGTLLATALLLGGLWGGRLTLLLGAPVVGYGLAWIGHFAFEKNRPASFRYPIWSLVSDYRMLWLWARGRLAAELAKAQRLDKA